MINQPGDISVQIINEENSQAENDSTIPASQHLVVNFDRPGCAEICVHKGKLVVHVYQGVPHSTYIVMGAFGCNDGENYSWRWPKGSERVISVEPAEAQASIKKDEESRERYICQQCKGLYQLKNSDSQHQTLFCGASCCAAYVNNHGGLPMEVRLASESTHGKPEKCNLAQATYESIDKDMEQVRADIHARVLADAKDHIHWNNYSLTYGEMIGKDCDTRCYTVLGKRFKTIEETIEAARLFQQRLKEEIKSVRNKLNVRTHAFCAGIAIVEEPKGYTVLNQKFKYLRLAVRWCLLHTHDEAKMAQKTVPIPDFNVSEREHLKLLAGMTIHGSFTLPTFSGMASSTVIPAPLENQHWFITLEGKLVMRWDQVKA